MKTLPIGKVILASFAFIFTHRRKILEISILPLALMIPLLFAFQETLSQVEGLVNITDIELPANFLVYLVLYVYGYITLSINVYRLVILGAGGVSFLTSVQLSSRLVRFSALFFLIAIATTLPILITGQSFLYLLVYFLVIPLVLNLVRIATDQPRIKWRLPILVQLGIFFLQAVLPLLVSMLFDFITSVLIVSWAVKALILYWTLISLALCYQLITANNSEKNP